APMPAPVVPLPEMPPINLEIHEHVNLFQQFPVPAIEVTAPPPVVAPIVEQVPCPEPILPIVQEPVHYHHYGYGHHFDGVYDVVDYSGYGPYSGYPMGIGDVSTAYPQGISSMPGAPIYQPQQYTTPFMQQPYPATKTGGCKNCGKNLPQWPQ